MDEKLQLPSLALEVTPRCNQRCSVDKAVGQFSPGTRLRVLADYHLWQRLTGRADGRIAADKRCAALFREARAEAVAGIRSLTRHAFPEHILSAVVEEPRDLAQGRSDLIPKRVEAVPQEREQVQEVAFARLCV